MNGDTLLDIVTNGPRPGTCASISTRAPRPSRNSPPPRSSRSFSPATGSPLPISVAACSRPPCASRPASPSTTASARAERDLYIGNYWGEVLFLKNDGSGVKPDFRQPSDINKNVVPTAKGSNTNGATFYPRPPCGTGTATARRIFLLARGPIPPTTFTSSSTPAPRAVRPLRNPTAPSSRSAMAASSSLRPWSTTMATASPISS